VIQQHWQYQDLQPDNPEHPHSAFWTTLQPILQEWMTNGDQIIMGSDANEDIRTNEITSFFNKFGMSEAILVAHGQDAPPTQNHRSHLIDSIFTTRRSRITHVDT